MARHTRPDGSVWYDHGNSDPEHPDAIFNKRQQDSERAVLGSFAKSNKAFLNQQNQAPKGQSQSSPSGGGFVKGIINIVLVLAVAYFLVRWIQHH